MLKYSTIFLLSLSITACVSKVPSSDSSVASVIKIGHAGPLTGSIGHLGQEAENGVRMAIEEINAADIRIHGRRVVFELVSVDDKAGAKHAVVAAKQLVHVGVAGVIGHFNSGSSTPASTIYHDARIPQISPASANPTYTLQGFNTTFRIVANDSDQGAILGQYAIRQLRARRIAIVDDMTSYGISLSDAFAKSIAPYEVTIVLRRRVEPGEISLSSLLPAIRDSNPDLIFYGGNMTESGGLLKSIRQSGVTATFLTGDGGQNDEFIRLAGSDAEGSYAAANALPVTALPQGSEFEAKYRKRFGELVRAYGHYAYDAAKALMQAMKLADTTDPRSYLEALRKLDYEGITGRIQFDDRGDLRNPRISLYQVRNGEWIYLRALSRTSD